MALRFSEPVQILNRSDVSVVERARPPGRHRRRPHDQGQPRRVIIPLRGPLLPFSYTVRYRVVSSDSHAVSAAFVFGVGKAKLGDPILAGSGGLSDTSPPSVAARAVELDRARAPGRPLVFRLLVWGPAVEEAGGLGSADARRAAPRAPAVLARLLGARDPRGARRDGRARGQDRGRLPHRADRALAHPSDAYRLVAASRFGDLLGWRCGALFLLVAIAFVVWNTETAEPPSAGRRSSMALMGAGRARGADVPRRPGPRLAGAARAAVGRRRRGAPRRRRDLDRRAAVPARRAAARPARPARGRAVARVGDATRFSKVALWSVVVISVTGLARMTGELSSPAQLGRRATAAT